MADNNAIRDKSFSFALRVVRLSQWLQDERKEFVLSKQIMRSGTSIGALVREAIQAESRLDFSHKMAAALKEANETEYWIDLLYHSKLINQQSHDSIKPEITELLKLLTSIIKTTRNSIEKQ